MRLNANEIFESTLWFVATELWRENVALFCNFSLTNRQPQTLEASVFTAITKDYNQLKSSVCWLVLLSQTPSALMPVIASETKSHFFFFCCGSFYMRCVIYIQSTLDIYNLRLRSQTVVVWLHCTTCMQHVCVCVFLCRIVSTRVRVDAGTCFLSILLSYTTKAQTADLRFFAERFCSHLHILIHIKLNYIIYCKCAKLYTRKMSEKIHHFSPPQNKRKKTLGFFFSFWGQVKFNHFSISHIIRQCEICSCALLCCVCIQTKMAVKNVD